MKSTNELQKGFVLHSRLWRETSLLIDVFTENHGKIALCARGVRAKKSPKRSLLQPLTPLFLSWRGRGELATLTVVEPASVAIKLSGDCLFSAFYINELLVRLLHRHDPHPLLFYQYQKTLALLSSPELLEQTLREFEIQLLKSIGYGLTLDHDSEGEQINENVSYLLNIDGMFQAIENKSNDNHSRIFIGRNLISIAEHNWQNTAALNDAKRLIRLSLQPLLGDKSLQSRNLFRRKVS